VRPALVNEPAVLLPRRSRNVSITVTVWSRSLDAKCLARGVRAFVAIHCKSLINSLLCQEHCEKLPVVARVQPEFARWFFRDRPGQFRRLMPSF
jgi:hypothetical protein